MDDEITAVLTALRGQPQFWTVKRKVIDAIKKGDDSNIGLSTNDLVKKLLKECDGEVLIANAAFHRRRAANFRFRDQLPRVPPGVALPSQRREPLHFIAVQQIYWMRKLVNRINMVLVRYPSVKISEARTRAFQLMTLEKAVDQITEAPLDPEMYIYDSGDLYKEMKGLTDPNFVAGGRYTVTHFSVMKPWGVVQVQLKSPNICELRKQYQDLRIELPQFGIDDVLPATTVQENFLDHWTKLGGRIIQSKRCTEALAYVRRGCPRHHRGALWSAILESPADKFDAAYMHELGTKVKQHDLFTDRLIAAEAKLLASRSDDYFVFEDLIKQTLLLMSRDSKIYERCSDPKPAPLTGIMTAEDRDVTVLYPPSGILPFRGIANYVAPLCFIYADSIKLYQSFTALYTRYFCQLHSISSSAEGLVRLCSTFEQLLQAADPALCLHFQKLGFEPLSVAMPWIRSAFSGVLQPDQVLLLWDRIVGFDSLSVLPVLAVAMFTLRRTDIFKAPTVKLVERVVCDNVTLNSIAMVQCFLFGESSVFTV